MPIVSNQTESGLDLYARFDDASNTAVDLTEGSGLDVGQYVASDAEIDAAGLAAGTYSARIFMGTAAAQANTDYFVGEVPEFKWDGTNEVLTSANAATAAAQSAAANTRVQAALSATGDLAGKVLGGGPGVITGEGVWANNAGGDALATSTAVGELATDLGVNSAAISAMQADVDALGSLVAAVDAAVGQVGADVNALPAPLDAAATRDALGMTSPNLDAQLDAIEAGGGGGETMPRINLAPDTGFIRSVPSNGPSNIVLAVRMPAGPILGDGQMVAIDMSPLYGRANLVQTVGVPTMAPGGTSLEVEALGPHDWYAYVLLTGTVTAGESQVVSLNVTMASGAVRPVTFRVKGEAA